MRFHFSCFAVLLGLSATEAFLSPLRKEATVLRSSFDPNEYSESMKAQSLEQMKNLKPEDIDKMLEEMENMNPLQAGAMKAMGMDPAMMKKSMEMMRDNPAMIENAKKLMENMSPDELLESSKKAQEQLKNMTPEDLDRQNQVMKNIPQEQMDMAVETIKAQQTTIDVEDEEDADMITGPGSSSDPEVIDSMFKVAEYMSEPPTDGGVTFTGFYSLPVIQLLSGDREFDLSPSELKECWADGSLGATRVDRAGFERVWNEVQEYFEQDIMTEARKEAKKKTGTKKKNRGSPKPASAPSTPATQVGANMSKDQLNAVNEQVKNMSSDDVGRMLDAMKDMGPAEESRMKAMGMDPTMMRETAKMLKENPQMAEMAQKMMQNMSPEDMLKSSQQAQAQMANMSEAEKKAALEEFKKAQNMS